MRFLEAYNWMSESRNNVCVRNNGDKYTVIAGNLMYWDNRCDIWKVSNMPVISLSKAVWSPVNSCNCKELSNVWASRLVKSEEKRYELETKLHHGLRVIETAHTERTWSLVEKAIAMLKEE